MRLLLPLLIIAIFITAVSGCRTRDFRTEGDILRARIAEMERDLHRMERENEELRAELRRQARVEETPEDVAEHHPLMVEIAFARFSHARDTTRDGMPDELRIYLQPRDSRGRFLQAAGELTVVATLLPEDPGVDPIDIGRMTLGPAEWRDAYRSGFMGVYYTAIMPISLPADAPELERRGLDRILVRVTFTDGVTGQVHRAEQFVSTRR